MKNEVQFTCKIVEVKNTNIWGENTFRLEGMTVQGRVKNARIMEDLARCILDFHGEDIEVRCFENQHNLRQPKTESYQWTELRLSSFGYRKDIFTSYKFIDDDLYLTYELCTRYLKQIIGFIPQTIFVRTKK